jgi:NAD(P)-dependent dehydrogenase (short-subunit alcohol dehydrogenase family)
MTDQTRDVTRIDLAGRCALVTGAARGIGLAVARQLAHAGARVLLCDVLGDALTAAAATVPGEQLCADVRDTDAIANWLNFRDAPPDILVNNAAIAPRTPLAQLDLDVLTSTFAVNVIAAIRLSQLVAARLISSDRGGSIINVSSVNAYRGHPDLLHYNASKAAMLSATRTMAAAWGPHHIRVNAVCPGSTWTDIWEEGGFSANDRENYASRNPMKRFATPEEIANVVTFLASEQSSFVNGAEIIADGGLLVNV